jgi:hypothetical protein
LESSRSAIIGQSRVSLVRELGIDIQSCIRSTGRRKKNGYMDVYIYILAYMCARNVRDMEEFEEEVRMKEYA